MEVVEGVTVKKIIEGVHLQAPTSEPKLLGMHNGEMVYLCHGKYGPYLKYGSIGNFSIPDWAKQENLNEMFNLYHAVKIIDYKMKKKYNFQD
jgi:topoisomerase IA-like protein